MEKGGDRAGEQQKVGEQRHMPDGEGCFLLYHVSLFSRLPSSPLSCVIIYSFKINHSKIQLQRGCGRDRRTSAQEVLEREKCCISSRCA